MTAFEQWRQREARYAAIAYELCKDRHPAFDLTPVIALVRKADELGFIVTKAPHNTGEGR